MRLIALIILLTGQLSQLHGQSEINPKINSGFEESLENMNENSETTDEDTYPLELIEHYRKYPMDLNKVSSEEILSSGLFSSRQSAGIIRHRNRYSYFLCIEELQVVDGFNPDEIRKLKSFIRFGGDEYFEKPDYKSIIRNGSHSFIARFIPDLNNTDSDVAGNYSGSMAKLYCRYRFTSGNRVKIGFTMEKDPGEKVLNFEKGRLSDFSSFFLSVRGKGMIHEIIIGDYSLQFGQGLATWSGMSYGKSSEVLMIRKNARKIIPYSSVDENNFYRGLAGTVRLYQTDFTVHISSNQIDARLTNENGERLIKSFVYDGYHRNDKEELLRNNAKIISAGISAERKKGLLSYGCMMQFNEYNLNVKKGIEQYALHNFNGKQLILTSLHASFLFKNINMFSELSMSNPGGIAALYGSIITLNKQTAYSFIYRNYNSNYQTIASAGFSEYGKTKNEEGFYSAIEFSPVRILKFSLSWDNFRHHWLKYQTSRPSGGNDLLFQITWKPRRHFESYLRFKKRIRESDMNSFDPNMPYLLATKENSIRWNIRYELNKTWEMGFRTEWKERTVQPSDKSSGMLSFIDLFYHPMNSKTSAAIRYLIYGTDDYDSRIYTYENDVLYNYSIPAHYGFGSKIYILFRYKINRSLDFWTKYSVNNKMIDTNGYQIEPNIINKKEIKFQLRLQF
ncbi:MAG: hypothetical protein DWQ39_00210 [Bacteroidetes bacterium]|nr:MAG: hypothetical protein DWQ39_00210 [Bacteroidota bacterium]